jgi:hypothetical protein
MRRGFSQALVTGRRIALPPVRVQERSASLPITEYLDDFKFDPQTKRVMGIAFEMTVAAVRLLDLTEPSKEIVAQKIIALTKEGMRNPDLLCEWALEDLC